jgi:hypothetical protein
MLPAQAPFMHSCVLNGLVFARQQDGCYRPICLCDNPDARATLKRVRPQEPQAVDERKLVLGYILCVQVTPIAMSVPLEIIVATLHVSRATLYRYLAQKSEETST